MRLAKVAVVPCRPTMIPSWALALIMVTLGSMPAFVNRLEIPGSAQSIATCYDGNPMAANGHAQRALGIGVFYSFLGTVFSILIMIVAAPTLANFAVNLGSVEFFAMTFFALTMVSGVSGDNIFKGLVAAFLGLGLGMVGLAPVDGVPRFTFGTVALSNGFSITPVVIGMFAMTEMLKHFGKRIFAGDYEQKKREKIRGFGFSLKEFFQQTNIFLGNHVRNNKLLQKRELLLQGVDYNPFVDPGEWKAYMRETQEKLQQFMDDPKNN